MAENMKLHGADEIIKRFEQLSEKAGETIYFSAARKSAQVIADQAKRNAALLNDPGTANDIADNVAVQKASKRGRKYRLVAYRIGIMGGARTKAENQANPGGDTFYWRFLDLGTKYIDEKPLLEESGRQAAGKAVEAFANQLDKKITAYTRKLAKTGGGK